MPCLEMPQFMVRVLFAERFNPAVFHSAAELLIQRGHSVEVMTNEDEVAQRLRESPPEVLVCGLSIGMTYITRLLGDALEQISTRIIQTVMIKEDGEVGMDWALSYIDAYLLLPVFHPFWSGLRWDQWAVVLAVEQQLYRPNVRRRANVQ